MNLFLPTPPGTWAYMDRHFCSLKYLSGSWWPSPQLHLAIVDSGPWFSIRGDFASSRQLAMSKGFLIVTTGEGATTGIQQVVARDSAKYPMMHRSVPYSKALSGPRYQSC